MSNPEADPYPDVMDADMFLDRYRKLSEKEWWSAHGPDEVHAVAYRAAVAWEKQIFKRVSSWEKILQKSVKTGLFGLGKPIMSTEWLFYWLFSKDWPPGLTRSEILTLRAAMRTSVLADIKRRLSGMPEEEYNPNWNVTKALKSFAALFRSEVLIPIRKDFSRILNAYSGEITEVCSEDLGYECEPENAKSVLYTAMLTGWRENTIPWEESIDTSYALPVLLHWIGEEAGQRPLMKGVEPGR